LKKYYDILGVPTGSSKTEIKRAYRKLVMLYHPDRNPNTDAAIKFHLIQEAYEILYNGQEPASGVTDPIMTPLQKREKEKEERLKKAKIRFEQQRRKEFQSNERFYRRMTTGKQWTIFLWGSRTCIGFMFLLVLDCFLPRHYEQDEFVAYSNQTYGGFKTGAVHLIELARQGEFYMEKMEYFNPSFDRDCFVQLTWLFHNPEAILQPTKLNMNVFLVDFGANAFFPILIFLFCIPMATLLYKRKNINFSILYHISYYVVFPIACLFLFSGERWVHLLSLGFL
jgi:curved DNA-binding protein CbpA